MRVNLSVQVFDRDTDTTLTQPVGRELTYTDTVGLIISDDTDSRTLAADVFEEVADEAKADAEDSGVPMSEEWTAALAAVSAALADPTTLTWPGGYTPTDPFPLFIAEFCD